MASLTRSSLALRRLLRPTARVACSTSTQFQQQQQLFSTSSSDYVLSEREQKYHDMGWMDDRGLTLFKTLHENQVRSCEIYADNELYGVHNDQTGEFEFASYRDFGQKVNRARHVLKDLGELS